jgi:hypothetical protein
MWPRVVAGRLVARQPCPLSPNVPVPVSPNPPVPASPNPPVPASANLQNLDFGSGHGGLVVFCTPHTCIR